MRVAQTRRLYPGIPPYFRALAEKHVIFYRVEEGDSILVVRILHATMLPEPHLTGSEDDD